METKEAIVLRDNVSVDEVNRYLPQNYKAFRTPGGFILIYGEDLYGWTMQDYVIPRLASGLITARELV